MSDELIASFGPLPRQHGVLGAMLDRGALPHPRHPRAPALPRLVAGRPPGHALLPRRADRRADGVIGAFYLTEKIGAADFGDEDEELIGLLAAHAAIAIANARLHEQTRELSIVAERNRLALDLHDSVAQKLFGLLLTAEAARTLLERDPDAARDQVAKLRDLAQESLDELRSLVFELRPPTSSGTGCAERCASTSSCVRRLGPQEVELVTPQGIPADMERDRELLRIAQEALQNALKHSQAQRVAVRLRADDGLLTLEIEDDGVGFDPAAASSRSRSLGLTSMEERARGGSAAGS